MVNVNGGFAYIDMSVFGEFTDGTAKTGVDLDIGGMWGKLNQTSKPVVICGLKANDDNENEYIFPAVVIAPYAYSVSGDDYVSDYVEFIMLLGDMSWKVTIERTVESGETTTSITVGAS